MQNPDNFQAFALNAIRQKVWRAGDNELAGTRGSTWAPQVWLYNQIFFHLGDDFPHQFFGGAWFVLGNEGA